MDGNQQILPESLACAVLDSIAHRSDSGSRTRLHVVGMFFGGSGGSTGESLWTIDFLWTVMCQVWSVCC